MLLTEPLTESVIGLAIEVHRHTGTGCLESVYEQCLATNWHRQGLPSRGRLRFPSPTREYRIGDSFKADIVVPRELILEVKAIADILPVHEVQLRTYLRISGIRVGLLLNFNSPLLIEACVDT